MEIKICGIRRFEDVKIINKYRPDYIGFIFAESKRKISFDTARELTECLADGIKTVGVFVNATYDEVRTAVDTAKIDVVQLHGDEDEEYIAKLDVDCEIWKAVRIRSGEDIPDIKGVDRILLDKYSNNEYGGSGERFDWSCVGDTKTDKPIILAGGLNSDNVVEGITKFKPICVDVSSGVEADGFKDEGKIKEFVKRVRNDRNE